MTQINENNKTEATPTHEYYLHNREKCDFIGYCLNLVFQYSGLYTEILLCDSFINESVLAHKKSEAAAIFQELELILGTQKDAILSDDTYQELLKIASEARASHQKIHVLLATLGEESYREQLEGLVELLEGYFTAVYGMYNALSGRQPIELWF